METLLSLTLCSCFGVRKKRKKPGTNMKEVVESGALAAFKIKKSVRFRQDEGVRTRAGGHGPSAARVEPNRVLKKGIKCRSRLKGKDGPGGPVDPRWLWGSASV